MGNNTSIPRDISEKKISPVEVANFGLGLRHRFFIR